MLVMVADDGDGRGWRGERRGEMRTKVVGAQSSGVENNFPRSVRSTINKATRLVYFFQVDRDLIANHNTQLRRVMLADLVYRLMCCV